MIFVNHSVEEHQLGAVNGLGQMIAAGARAIGPAAGGFLWSLSVHVHFVFINFICAIFIFLLMQYIVSLLPDSIDTAKKRDDKNLTIATAGKHEKGADVIVDQIAS